MSIKTGMQPNWIKGFIVVGKPAATVIISSPGKSALLLREGEVNE